MLSSNNPSTAAQRRAGLTSSRLPAAIAPQRVAAPDGANEGIALTALPKTASQYIPATSSGGACSFDAVVIGSTASRSCDYTPGNPPIVTHTFTVVPIHDIPDPPASVTGVATPSNLIRSEQRIAINDKELVEWDKSNPYKLWLIGTGISPDQAHLKGTDKKKADRAKFRTHKIAIARGCPVEVQTNAVSKLDGAKEVGVGDVLTLSNVTYKIDHSKTKDKDGKEKMVVYENLHAGNLRRVGAWNDVPHMHNDIFFTLFAILPHFMPNFPALVRKLGWDPAAADTAKAEAARKAAEDAARAKAEANGMQYMPPAATAAPDVEKVKSKAEKSKLAEESLSDSSRLALRQFPFTIPKFPPCPAVGDYLGAHGIPAWKVWQNLDQNNILLEPGSFQRYNYDCTDQQPSTDATKKDISYHDPCGVSADGKQHKYSPSLRYELAVKQALPEKAQEWEKLDEHGKPIRQTDGAQDVVVTVSNSGPGLFAFGMAEPLLLGQVGPVLFSACPAINNCYVSDKEAVVSSSEQGGALKYALGGVVKVSDWKGKGNAPAASRLAASWFVDLAAGVVSRGYPIDTATAEKFIKIKQNMPGVGKTRVSDNMAHSTNVNPYADENPIGKKNVRSPVQNILETGVSFKDEKEDLQMFLVSNWALRDYLRSPQIEALHEAMKVFTEDGKVDAAKTFERVTKFYSKLMLDIAEGRLPKGMSKKERLDDPASSAANEEVLAHYAAKLRDWAGLPKDTSFPIAAVDIPEVFGPMHMHDEENNSESPSKRPFQFALFGIRLEYLRDRLMLNYFGDNWYQDVLYERYGAPYRRALEGIDKGTLKPYNKWLLETNPGAGGATLNGGAAANKDTDMTDASNKRKEPTTPSKKGTTTTEPPGKAQKAEKEAKETKGTGKAKDKSKDKPKEPEPTQQPTNDMGF